MKINITIVMITVIFCMHQSQYAMHQPSGKKNIQQNHRMPKRQVWKPKSTQRSVQPMPSSSTEKECSLADIMLTLRILQASIHTVNSNVDSINHNVKQIKKALNLKQESEMTDIGLTQADINSWQPPTVNLELHPADEKFYDGLVGSKSKDNSSTQS